jgi:HSP20 family protein
MRTRIQPVLLPPEVGEFAEDVRRIFLDLAHSGSAEALSGECAPPLDVYETDESVDISMDLPGVAPDAVRIVIKGDAVLIAGHKSPRRGRGESSFHLVERGFGRFARLVRLPGACDMAKGRAALRDGELRISFPKLGERRGQRILLPIAPS